MRLDGKVALVTGAGSGIGRAAALQMADAGARVVLNGRNPDALDEVAGEITAKGFEASKAPADISDASAIRDAVEDAASRFNRLDIVFANAGINGVWAPIEELEPDDWRTTVDINLTGTFLTIKYAAPFLKRQGGSIVVTSSVNGTRMFSNTGATAYACTKAAQVVMVKMLALELAESGVRVNAICPGAIETDIDESTEFDDGLEQARVPVRFPEGNIPLTGGKPGSAAQVAELVLFLASDASSHITGSEMWIDGGQSLLQG